MRTVTWTDGDGLQHRALCRDTDDNSHAREHGIRLDPPDVIAGIDWTQVARDLHNQLVARRLATLDDVRASQDGLTAAVLAALKRKVVELYQSQQSDTAGGV